MNNVTIPEPIVKSFDLVFGNRDGSIDNAAVPVRWCLTPALLKQIRDSGMVSPRVVVLVTYHYDSDTDYSIGFNEERHVFPLEQFIAYVPLSRPGNIQVNAYLMCADKVMNKAAEHEIVKRNSYGDYYWGRLWVNAKFESGQREVSNGVTTMEIVASAEDYRLNIPKELFGKPLPNWLAGLVNRYNSSPAVDQCEQRRRLLFFPIKLMFIVIEAFMRWIGIAAIYLWFNIMGYVNVETRYLRHPLIYGWDAYSKGDYKFCMVAFDEWAKESDENSWQQICKLIVAFFVIPYRIVVVPLASMGIGLIANTADNLDIVWWYGAVIPIAIMTALVVVLLGMVGVVMLYESVKTGSIGRFSYNWLYPVFKPIDDFCDKIADKVDAYHDRKYKAQGIAEAAHLAKVEKYLTCDNKPHDVVAEPSAIPFKDQTMALRYTSIKNKVCKPMVH